MTASETGSMNLIKLVIHVSFEVPIYPIQYDTYGTYVSTELFSRRWWTLSSNSRYFVGNPDSEE